MVYVYTLYSIIVLYSDLIIHWIKMTKHNQAEANIIRQQFLCRDSSLIVKHFCWNKVYIQ